MATLITAPNLRHHDDVYQWLVALLEGRPEEESVRVSATLLLILINHIGDEDVVRQAIRLARECSG